MKRKKGFTLIELLGVIVVLGLLALIVVPAVDSTVKKSKQKAYDNQVEAIKTALKHWATDNKSNFLDSSTTISLTLANLKAAGYIDYDFINPKTNAPFSNESNFTININEGKFEYIIDNLMEGDLSDTQTITCDVSGESINFEYTGSSQIFNPACDGRYKFEVWGAKGGASQHSTSTANVGGYSIGTVTLSANTILYIYVGGVGIGSAESASTRIGGYNGGGYVNMTGEKADSATGGGASDIRIGGISLYQRVIVAGGGGGNGCTNDVGGVGGGSSGAQGTVNTSYGTGGGGGTQTSGGAKGVHQTEQSNALPGVFGKGGDVPSIYPWASGAGGGGWYGGGAGSAVSGGGVSGGGGSGWVYTASTFSTWSTAVGKSESDKWKLTPNYYLTDAATYKSGDSGFVANPAVLTGDGYIKITYLGV